MPFSPDQVRVFQTGEVWVAPYGTTIPTDMSAVDFNAYDTLGYISEEGFTYTSEMNVSEIMSWQSKGPIRIPENSRITRFAMSLMEWNDAAVEVFFGGGSFTSLGGGIERFNPPDPGTVTEWTVIFDTRDGNVDYRWVFDKAVLTEAGDVQFTKDAAALLPVTLTALGGTDGSAGWRVYRDANAATS